MIERRSVTVPRSWVTSVVLTVFLGIAVLGIVGMAWFRQGERLETLAKRMEDVATDAKDASEANTIILEEARQRDLDRQPTINAAIQRIIDDNAEAHAALLGEVARLLNRPAPVVTVPVPRPATRTPATTVAPRAGGSPAAPPTTAAKPPPVRANPPTTPTTCPTRGKSERCR